MKDPSRSNVKIKHILVAGFCLQVVVTLGVYLTGASGKLPNFVDTNGIATSFASDGISYRNDALLLRETLLQSGMAAWVNAREELHTRLYSISFLLFGPILGYTILGTAPFNIFYFLLILYLVYSIGKEAFGVHVGLLSAGIVGLWPSFLLHSTQLLRDQLFIIGILGVILMGAKWLSKAISWRLGVVTGALASIAVLLLWYTRSDTWHLITAIVLVVIFALVVQQLKARKIWVGNLVGASLLFIVTLSAPHVLHTSGYYKYNSVATQSNSAIAGPRVEPGRPVVPIKAIASTVWTPFPKRISTLRQRFILLYPNATSNLDTDTTFNNTSDIIYYLPRAATIGFFAPFPNMWFAVGNQTGRAGRILSGAETLVMYVFELLALIALWFRRDQMAAWLLWLAAAISLTALGLVVTNLGTLYRMRYAFWMLLIIIGADGAIRTLAFFRSWKSRGKVGSTGPVHEDAGRDVDADRALMMS